MSKLTSWLKTWQWYIVAYVVLIVLFWFAGASPKLTKAEAYFALVGLHALYAGGVWVVRNILRG